MERQTGQLASDGDRDAGFSLIEVLIALVLIAMMTSILTSAIGQLRKIGEVNQKLVLQQEADTLADQIVFDLQTPFRRPLLVATSAGKQVVFRGSGDAIEFVAAVRTGFKSLGVRQVRYDIIDNGGRLSLRRRLMPYRPAVGSEASDVVSTHIDMIQFQYLGDKETVWRTNWDAANQLPAGLRFSLILEEEKIKAAATRQIWLPHVSLSMILPDLDHCGLQTVFYSSYCQ
ncbi:PulJ/GspJ family protein [Agrobacterium vitis]|uniref:Prepilin-type N-terminal cleavage/methylation domain-containing protein n=1 Tax=Agrobacterium vitis TaxID=373 RepID=A0A7K1RN65_AGRVI|nr:prepilin-type N-terminal cleavage/methylation domain-containing protein [Agrobacterium vitis]MVA59464.1 prepilin-type N-terminal cleavage/methylation domain-containing protein [Agrobacterium vitis]